MYPYKWVTWFSSHYTLCFSSDDDNEKQVHVLRLGSILLCNKNVATLLIL